MENLLTSEMIRKSLPIIIPLAIFLTVLLAGCLLRAFLFSRLSRWAAKTDSRMGEAIISAAKSPSLVLCIMLGAYVALEFSDLPKIIVEKANKGLSILAVVAVTMAAANILCAFTRMRSEKIESVLPITSLTDHIILIVVYGVGTLIILNRLGISIAPLLATLGVGGLACGAPLQGPV